MKNTKRRVLIIIFILTVGYIWIHSMIPPAQSSNESSIILEFVRPLLEIFVGKGNATNNMVRKIAHFVEYGALGIELALFIVAGWIAKKKKSRVNLGEMKLRTRALVSIGVGFLIAFIDETIQIFSGRGPLISDVWLDTAGVTAGVLVVTLITKIKRK